MPKNDSVPAALGQNVRQTRESKQLAQEKLAEFAGLDPTCISGIDTGPKNSGQRKLGGFSATIVRKHPPLVLLR